MNPTFIKYLLFTILTIHCTYSEVFTSIGHLQILVESIIGVTKNLETLISNEQERLNEAKKLLHDFQELSQQASKDATSFIANPVNAFLIIKKLSLDLKQIIDSINDNNRIKSALDNIKEKYLLPTEEDYRGAIEGIHRLEAVYQLDTKDIRNGNLSKKYPSRPLSAFECFELGRIAYTNRDFYHTLRWMQEAYNQATIEEVNNNITMNKLEILDYLSYSTYQQGNLKHAFDLIKQIIEIDENYPRAKSNYEYFKELLDDASKVSEDDSKEKNKEINNNNPFEIKNNRPKAPFDQRDLYETLCREGSKPMPQKIIKKLKCYYLKHNPLILIAPIKAEKINHKPEIWIYHEFVTNEQVEIMKNLANPKLSRAIVRNPITGQQVTADYRISKSGWLLDNESPKLAYMTKLVSATTNLSMETAEEWQIANYGIGGQYEPHFDFARKSEPADAFEERVGNRIATLLIYLEAPEKGGATVFPYVNLSIQPERRAAAFWYNLHTSGDGDYDTRHAACPVLFGTKWVSNKWLHYGGQEFRRPCKLKREYSPEMFD